MPTGLPQPDLFAGAAPPRDGVEVLADGVVLLHGFATTVAADLVAAIGRIAAKAPFRRMETPGGHRMSAAMTNCGRAGWVADRTGYRYDPADPESGRPWPRLPTPFRDLAGRAADTAGFPGFVPDACLINRYEPGSRLSLHQDRDERDFTAPIVSVSLGLPAIFLVGGLKRAERPRRVVLANGDIVVWGGPARMIYHGVAPIADGAHPLTGNRRYNLTFRKAL